MRGLFLVFTLLFAVAPPVAAQFTETFADGDFTENPAWTGATDLWTVVPFGANFALRSNGPSVADTLHLATASTQAFGQWAFTFRYEGGQLSNFNLARIFLLADTADLTGDVRGYHLQIGTNDRDVRLYRSDPDASGGRALLAQSDADVVTGDARTVNVVVTRTITDGWAVSLDGVEVLTATETDNLVNASTHFGLWVKHSPARNQGYFFDDIVVTPDLGPVDVTPPTVTEVRYDQTFPGFFVFFSETIDMSTVSVEDFTIEGVDTIVSIGPLSGVNETDGVSIQLPSFLPTGDYDVTIRNVADLAGNVLADTTVTVPVVTDATPPSLLGVSALSAFEVEVAFDEPVNAFSTTFFEISNGITVVAVTTPIIPENPVADVITLAVSPPLTSGTTYTLTVHDIPDQFGNVLSEASATFTFLDTDLAPEPGEVVVNEIMYDPPSSALEYVEFYNASEQTFDLSGFAFSDDRLNAIPITDVSTPFPGGAYVVVARDSAAFADAFPGVPFFAPPGMPALNNSGDTAVLFFGEAVIDSVAYEPAWGGDGVSLERRDPNGPSNTAANWGSSVSVRGGTPAERNSIFSVDNTPPALVSVLVGEENDALIVTFDEPLDPATVAPEDFAVEGAGTVTPVSAEVTDATVALALPAPLAPGDYVLVVTDVADFFGNTLGSASAAFTILAPALPEPRDVVVNEIMYDPPEGAPEFVELFNRSEKTFDLRDFGLSDNRLAPVPVTDAVTPLEPGAFAVLVADGEAFAAAFPGVAFLEVTGWPTLNNSGDAVVLFAGQTVIDSVAYAPAWGGEGVSLERRDPAGPSSARVNWGDSTDPSGATPGAVNAIFAPDTTPPNPFFAEQTDARRIEVFFDEPLDPASVAPGDFDLDGVMPASLLLLDDGARVRLVFAANLGGATLTVRDVRDLTGNTLASASLDVALLAAPGEIVINEIMYDPLADPDDGRIDQPEYVELFNRTDHLVSLRDFYRTDAPDETGAADTTRFVFGPAAVAPANFAVIFSQPSDLDDADLFSQSQLALAFPAPYAELGATLLPVRASSLGLLNGGDLIRIHRADDVVIDAVSYDPAWHNDALAATDGIALERIDPAGPSDAATNWASSEAPEGGTPGRVNSVLPTPDARAPEPGEIVVNEIMYEPLADAFDNRPDQPEYVEFFNRSAEALQLNGLFLTDRPDENGVADTIRIAFAPTALPPGGYAVVYTVPSGTATDSLTLVLTRPFPDLDPSAPGVALLPIRRSLALDNGGDLVRLHASDGVVLDEVAYSPQWHHPNLRDTRGTALERITPEAPSDLPENWTSSVAEAGGTPGFRNSVFLLSDAPVETPGITVEPSPFSPDRDGMDDVAEIRYTLRADAALVRARIFDASGRLVRTLEDTGLTARTGALLWDGLDDDARELRIGIYVVYLEAVSPQSGATEAYKAPVVLARPLN